MTERESETELSSLFAKYFPKLVALGTLLLGDVASAEDAVQDAFTGLARAAPLRDPAAAAGYLRTAVVNAARDVHRRRRVLTRILSGQVTRPAAPADEQFLHREDQREVVRALHRLSRRQREVLVLRYWEDLSEAEIASTLGISAGSVKSSASRGIARLQSILTEHSNV